MDYTLIDPYGSSSYAGSELRTWQLEALGNWIANERVGLVEAVTGTGKTVVGLTAIREVLVVGGVAVVLVPTRGLLDQWVKQIRQFLPSARVGEYTGGKKAEFADGINVIVSTVQTFYSKPVLPRSLGLLVADEVHRYGSREYSKAMRDEFKWRIGLSGSLYRNDDGVENFIEPYFGPVIKQYSYGEALSDDVVAPFSLALVGTEFTSREKSAFDEAQKACDDARKKLVERFNYPGDWLDFFACVNDALRNSKDDRGWDQEISECGNYMKGFSEKRRILAEAKGKYDFVSSISDALSTRPGTLVFTETKVSADELAGTLIERGVPARSITSDHNDAERKQTLREFQDQRLAVLCAPRVLDEGIDVPESELAIIVATSKTKRQMIQRMGRVIRKKPDGRRARILILFVKGTSEDPETGGHEAFLDEITKHCSDEPAIFDHRDESGVGEWLSS
jgi:superfamily II DNA or RNA helicase